MDDSGMESLESDVRYGMDVLLTMATVRPRLQPAASTTHRITQSVPSEENLPPSI